MAHVPIALEQRQLGCDPWSPMLAKLLASYDGVFAIRFSERKLLRCGRKANTALRPEFVLHLRNTQALEPLLLGSDPLRYAEAYFREDIDIEGDMFAAMALKDGLQQMKLSVLDRLRVVWSLLRARSLPSVFAVFGSRSPWPGPVRTHSREENHNAISFHYNLSNDFYRLWLGQGMVYSCAYFEQPQMGLAQAQTAKLEHICRKLQLQPGERLLDIGCGWGALLIHAAQNHGVIAHGITLSERQHQHVQARIQELGLQAQVSVALQDYRDLQGHACYDKIASIGMFEHVGLKNLAPYFDGVHRLLKPHGFFLNHGITHDEEGWQKSLSSNFINRYVFPDGELDTVGNVQRAMEKSRFEIMDVEGLRPHYARTLRYWVAALEAQHAQALEFVDESTYRIWRLYMAGSAMEFEEGRLGVYQILSTPRGTGTHTIPLTRRHLYPQEPLTAERPLRAVG